MTYGLQFKNSDGDILIDSDFHHYHFVGHATYVEGVRIPALTGGNNTKHSYTGSTGLSSTQINGDIFKYRISCAASDVPPIVFIKPSYAGSGAPFCGLILTQAISSTVWEFWVLQDHGYNRPSLYCFNRFDKMTSGQSTVPSGVNQGIVTFNSSGNKTYDTRFKPLKVIANSVTTAPSLARDSIAASYNPTFTPINVNNIDYATGGVETSDIMFYAPSIAHSCQSVKGEKSGDGFQSAGYNSYFYAWVRADLWWCFYRNTFRLYNTTRLQSGYSIYASGHVYKSQEDSSSIFNIGTVLGAIFTFGASLFITTLASIAIGAAVASAFTDAGLVSGVYFPYENDSRNAGQSQPVIFSRPSYYGLETGIGFERINQVDGNDPTTDPYSGEYIPNFVFYQNPDVPNTGTFLVNLSPGVRFPGAPPWIVIQYNGTTLMDNQLTQDFRDRVINESYIDIGNYRVFISPDIVLENSGIAYYYAIDVVPI